VRDEHFGMWQQIIRVQASKRIWEWAEEVTAWQVERVPSEVSVYTNI
jgi:hypothetical protein